MHRLMVVVLAAVMTAVQPGSALAQTGVAASAFTPLDPAPRVAVKEGVWSAGDESCPSRAVDAGLRQRLVDTAVQEWKRFNFPVLDYRKRGLNKVIVPDKEALIPDRLNSPSVGIIKQAPRLGYMEDDREVRRAIGGYWTAVPSTDAFEAQSGIFQKYGSAGWAYPWSAAFISFLVCSAGVDSLEAFHRSGSHFDYIDQAITAADVPASPSIYRAREVDDGLPQPGDLLCADRTDGKTPYRTIADRKSDHSKTDMHCDLVVKVSVKGGYVALIGGNVLNAVTLTLVNIRKVPGRPERVETAADAPGARAWFAVLALQAPGDAKLELTPALVAP